MNRRDFIRSMAGAGAVFATGRLPAVEDLRQKGSDACVFAKRGRFERLSIAYGAVEIGLERPFSILHISDTHLTAVGEKEEEKKQTLHIERTRTFGGHQEEALRDSIDWARQHTDYLIHTGDLIDFQSEANFALVKKYFGEGMAGCLGNHEFSENMWLSEPQETPTEGYKDRSRARLAEAFPFDISIQSTVVNGVNFVTMDDVYGTVTPRQVERFQAEVKRGLPIVLGLHVPFYTDAILRADLHFWATRECKFRQAALPSGERLPSESKRQRQDPTTRDFIASLKGEKALKAILAGHLHVTIDDQFSPTARQYVVGGNFLFSGREMLFY